MDLNQKKFIHLLNQLRSQVPDESASVECKDVCWDVPRHFGGEAIDRITDLANVLAGFLQRKLRDLCNEGLEIKFTAATEHYACFLSEQVERNCGDHYFLSLSMQGKERVGFVQVSLESCARMISQVLRDPDGQIGVQGQLSDLEQSILQDILAAICDSLCEGFSVYGEITLEKTEQIVCGRWPLNFQQLEDMIRITFQTVSDDMPLEISLCLLDRVVDSIAGTSRVRMTPEQQQKMPEHIIAHMADAVMDLSVWLNPSTMTFQDIMALEKGDFVLLDHTVTTPVNVHVNGRACFKAWPAQSAGRGAVVLTPENSY